MQHACKILNMFEILISVVWGKKLQFGRLLGPLTGRQGGRFTHGVVQREK